MIIQQSWLYTNNARNYPLKDGSNVDLRQGLVDCHVSFPANLSLVDNVYVSRLVVTQLYAEVEVSLGGLGVLGTLAVQNPQAYRMYGLSTASSAIHGFVMFGQAAEAGGTDIEAEPTEAQATLLESLVYRSKPSALSGFLAGGSFVEGVVLFRGANGVVCEVKDVYYDDENASHLSLVFRLEHDASVMIDPVPECSRLLESGAIRNLVNTVNGVRPDSQGRVYLEFEGGSTLLYDAEGRVQADAEGNPLYDESTPVASLVPGGDPHVIGIRDNLDYNLNCANKRVQRITYGRSDCAPCQPEPEQGQGLDGAGGAPISFAGAEVLGSELTTLWYYHGAGVMALGTNAPTITVASGADPVFISSSVVAQGVAPTMPGAVVACTGEHGSPGETGLMGVVRHQLSRAMAPGEKFSLVIPEDVVRSSPDTGDPAMSRAYRSCTFTTRDPRGALTDTEQAQIDGECF